jgi:CRP-like cAMP-binding protein
MTRDGRFRTVLSMTTKNEYLEELADIEPFRGLWRRQLVEVARSVDVLDVEAGTVVVERGGRGHELFLVVAGSATVADDAGPTAMLGPSDTIGEVAVIAGAPQPATVTAASQMRLLVMGRRELLGLLKAVPSLGQHLLRGMAERLGKAERGRNVAPGVSQEVPDDPGTTPEPRGALRP